MQMDVKPYLEYLDKEMTIMGILSAAAIAAPAWILNLSLSHDLRDYLWKPDHFFIVLGSTLCVCAALAFYKERADLAWYYGQITLAQTLTDQKPATEALEGWLKDADSWETWWPYCWGFLFLVTGFVEYFFVLVFLLGPEKVPWLSHNLWLAKRVAFWAGPAIVALVAPFEYYVRTRYKYHDDAWRDFRRDLFRRLRRKHR
jgi:hypothetical protein